MKLHQKVRVWIVGLVLLVAGQMANAASEGSATSAVYVMSNKVHNSVPVFQRAADGRRTALANVDIQRRP
jgi:hypothetical protein